jgi:hypothetical protein
MYKLLISLVLTLLSGCNMYEQVHPQTVDFIDKACAANGGAQVYGEISDDKNRPACVEGQCNNGMILRTCDLTHAP